MDKLITINGLGETLPRRFKDISNDYERFLFEEEEDASKRPPGIHASEISSCSRKACYTMSGAEKKISKPTRIKWHWKFRHGHAIHDLLQQGFDRMAAGSDGLMEFEAEVPITPQTSIVAAEHRIYSHCDGVFSFYQKTEGNQRVLTGRLGLEIKSASPKAFEDLKGPKKEHIEQGHVYMACLDLPAIWFLYFNKGNENQTPSHLPYLVKFNRKIWEKLAERFEGWWNLVDSEQLPDREESIVCEFCPYAWVCDPEYLKKKAKRALEPVRRVTYRRRRK